MTPLQMDIVGFIETLIATWSGYWEAFNNFFETWASFGVGPVVEAVEIYGVAEPTPTWTVVSVVYVVARLLPTVALIYFVVRRLFPSRDRWVGVAAAIGYLVADYTLFGIILGTKPLPTETFTTVSHGPTTLYHVLGQLWLHDKGHLFVVFSVFIVFFGVTFLLFYMINYAVWFVTLTFMEEPWFSKTSGKGHALWLAIIWIFYLVMLPAGYAFLNTLVVLAVMIVNRSRLKESALSRGSSSENASPATVDHGGDVPPTPEQRETSRSSRLTWVDE